MVCEEQTGWEINRKAEEEGEILFAVRKQRITLPWGTRKKRQTRRRDEKQWCLVFYLSYPRQTCRIRPRRKLATDRYSKDCLHSCFKSNSLSWELKVWKHKGLLCCALSSTLQSLLPSPPLLYILQTWNKKMFLSLLHSDLWKINTPAMWHRPRYWTLWPPGGNANQPVGTGERPVYSNFASATVASS